MLATNNIQLLFNLVFLQYDIQIKYLKVGWRRPVRIHEPSKKERRRLVNRSVSTGFQNLKLENSQPRFQSLQKSFHLFGYGPDCKNVNKKSITKLTKTCLCFFVFS